jgi:anti-sigma B factor antagonist
MEISERKVGPVTVIDLKGETHAPGQFAAFQEVVRERVAAGERWFVVNLSGCGWIDSSGLGELIKSFIHVMRQGGMLKLAAVPQKVRAILTVTNLTEVLDLYDDESLAVESFRA